MLIEWRLYYGYSDSVMKFLVYLFIHVNRHILDFILDLFFILMNFFEDLLDFGIFNIKLCYYEFDDSIHL